MPTFRKLIGFALASTYSLAYLLVPFYMIALTMALFLYYRERWPYYMLAPIALSIIVPPISSYSLITSRFFSCLRDYFDYEEVFEISDADMITYPKPFILAGTPHGVISFGGLCAGTGMIPEYRNLKTGVASIVLKLPILKHLLGVFNLIDVGGQSLRRHVRNEKKSNIDRSVVIYTGGIAELFKCSSEKETLQTRKGFIKLALQEGLDIVPMYFFGNTSVLSIPTNKSFEKISRKLQMSLTYFYGSFGLPVPRPNKILYVRGKPIALPHIKDNLSEEQWSVHVDKYHEIYTNEVKRIFNQYKNRVPGYGSKEFSFQDDSEDKKKK
jgi:hypothetical protein